jgi:LytS/YehU family sensor histidine kinase
MQDRKAANKYLTGFARLIRKNLDSSQKAETTLSDEIERL